MDRDRQITVIPPIYTLAKRAYERTYGDVGKPFSDLEDRVREVWLAISRSFLDDLGLMEGDDLTVDRQVRTFQALSKQSVSKENRPQKKYRHWNRVTSEEEEEMNRLYKAGLSGHAIAERMGRSTATVYKRVQKESDGRTRNRKLTMEQAEEIRAKYTTGGISYMGLAAAYGISHNTVYQIVKHVSYRKADTRDDSSPFEDV